MVQQKELFKQSNQASENSFNKKSHTKIGTSIFITFLKLTTQAAQFTVLAQKNFILALPTQAFQTFFKFGLTHLTHHSTLRKSFPSQKKTEENLENFKNKMQKDNSLTETNQELKNLSKLDKLSYKNSSN